MTITYGDLSEVDLGTLGAAVTDWKSTADGLKTLAESARDGMLAKSDTARWAGANATVTRGFVAETAKEIADLHTEASSIHRLLDDAHTELTALQKRIRTAGEVDAPNLGIKIQDLGDGRVRCFYPHTRGDTDERTQDQLDARQELEDRINRILAHATEIDTSVNRALATTHGNDAHNAGHSSYDSLDDAQSERALELARKGEGMSDRELVEFNQIMRFNGTEKGGEFATSFFKGLGGPEETLEFYAQMSIDGTDATATGTRLDAVRELQRYMGPALANATDPDTKHHLPDSWGAEFRRLGTQEISWQKGQWGKPYGYQVLGGLLRFGNYDPRFLTPIAEHVTQLHQKDPYFFIGNKAMGSSDAYGFNPSGRLGSGNDPLNSVLEALGHSPEAAEDFFTGTPTAYDQDGVPKKESELDFTSYLDLFTDEEFTWTVDTNDTNVLADEDKALRALAYGPEALGHALEAAATGRPYDNESVAAVPHTTARAGLVSDIVDKFGEHPELVRRNANGDIDEESGPLYAMRDSLGDITAEYMGDFQRAMYREDAGSRLFPSFGEPVDLDSANTQRFLGEVGQDPGAYAAITSAQQSYTSQTVDRVINGDSDSTASLDGRVSTSVAPGAAMAGIMSDARATAIYEYHTASDQEFNEAAADNQKWVDRILGMGIDLVGERVPVAGTVLGWAAEDIQESIMKSVEKDTTAEAEISAGNEYSHGRDAAMESAQAAVDRALVNNQEINSGTAEDLRAAARTSAGNSHAAGAQWNSEGNAK
ncbi:hypothetical protein DF268_36545 [Streptomyces sp. V2]|uniref:DUF6571 family protein n=1 Tax=Streptomyces TaxID=1883 RepID=UPI0006EB3B8F|nr:MULTISPECIES: DUF6571 family protein [Streptomyces]PWG08672.1 hypothetical protein DF268_36545 [Streptomyces sp. V2]